jgi:hypothetical protein
MRLKMWELSLQIQKGLAVGQSLCDLVPFDSSTPRNSGKGAPRPCIASLSLTCTSIPTHTNKHVHTHKHLRTCRNAHTCWTSPL